ncbi:MAG: 4-hydroxyphenylacetate 3-monooxygenase, oxygenase component [Chloroflexota bacterium]|nr:4-hydroxyphenylacetate 3-monooxygenase, oxygenase component [Chloroflexota bacterium]
MPARTGQEYLQGLKERPPEVWVGGQRVEDVTSHPGFANGARSVAALYDMQNDPTLLDEMTYWSPTTGDRVGMSFKMPENLDDLERRRRMFYRWATYHGGMMGRTPDYMNAAFVAMASAAPYFDMDREGFGENVRRYYELIREQDLCLTHTLVNPQRSRSPQRYITDSLAEDVALKVVKETDSGILVRGARVLATLGPLSDEIAVYPSRSHHTADNAHQYAVSFSIPSNTPGLRYICRESFDYGRTPFDHPLGARFEEMDAVAIFDNVLVPWERVFLLGDVDSCNNMTNRTGWIYHSFHQVVTRLVAKTEFLLGTASLMVETLGSGDQAHVQERIAEMIMNLEVIKALLRSAEVDAAPDEWGLLTPARVPLTVAENMYARSFYPRMIEIMQLLGSSSLMALPGQADFDSEIAPDLEHYLATDTATALDRTKLFHLAWDISCSAFGARSLHYERFFAGDQVRNAQIMYATYDRSPMMESVQKFLDRE